MATDHSIQPFPDSINREHFASWLSGFTDGEGCFRLGIDANAKLKRRVPFAQFLISLRSDDEEALRLIQSFLGCGKLYADSRAHTKTGNPKTSFRVSRTAQLATIVIPHFDSFPLFAKKHRDFSIWKEGVLLLNRVLANGRGSRANGISQWTKTDHEEFAKLVYVLKEQRRFMATDVVIPKASRLHERYYELFP